MICIYLVQTLRSLRTISSDSFAPQRAQEPKQQSGPYILFFEGLLILFFPALTRFRAASAREP